MDVVVEAGPARPGPYFRRVPWRWDDLAIALAPLVVLRLAPDWTYRVIAPVPRAWLVVSLLQLGWMFGFPVWVARRRLGEWPGPPRPGRAAIDGMLAILAAPACLFMMGLLFDVLRRWIGDPMIPGQVFEPYVNSRDRFDQWAMIGMAVVAAPIAEEAMFRGLVYGALRQRMPAIFAMVIQAATFALGHAFGPAGMASVLVAGLILGVFYTWRRSLLASILLHAAVNALAMAAIASGVMPEPNGPRLGVFGEPADGGCRITRVVPGLAGDAAGIRVGDVVTAIDGHSVANIAEMAAIIHGKEFGDRVSIDLRRDGQVLRVEAEFRPLRESAGLRDPADARRLGYNWKRTKWSGWRGRIHDRDADHRGRSQPEDRGDADHRLHDLGASSGRRPSGRDCLLAGADGRAGLGRDPVHRGARGQGSFRVRDDPGSDSSRQSP